MKSIKIGMLIAVFSQVLMAAEFAPKNRMASIVEIQADLNRIVSGASWSDYSIVVRREAGLVLNQVEIICRPGQFVLSVAAGDDEWGATAYLGLQKLGFLFPHPRVQMSPKIKEAKQQCGRKFVWKPSLKYRGFHLHTQHPSEWVDGFLMGREKIAEDFILWLARNQQNLLQVVLLKTIDDGVAKRVSKLFKRAGLFGIYTGLSISYAFGQQRSYALFSKFEVLLSFFGFSLAERLEQRLVKFTQQFHSDFVTFELGTSEFTKTDEKATLNWLNLTHRVLKSKGRQVFIKIHVSTDQKDAAGANFNFLPGKSHPDIGVLPHTVMFYSLTDDNTPVYGRTNFNDIKNFTVASASKRPTFYFPETSYFVAFDIDVPLLLTDYLVSRTEDMKFLIENNIPGQLVFTTGQELGYWLFDWQMTLSTNMEYATDPLAAVKLLGENPLVWKKILDFQTRYFKNQQLIKALSSSTILDELPFLQSPHERVPVTEFEKHRDLIRSELKQLEFAITQRPSLSEVKNGELKALLEVTWLRLEHARDLRRAILAPNETSRANWVAAAILVRQKAQVLISDVRNKYSRYPESFVFDRVENITSYGFGYGWAATTLHFWKREEEMIKNRRYYPWVMNIYNPFRFLL